MSTPTEPSRDELRALRERAYGPAADIHDDPVALARLHELEDAARIPAGEPATAPPALSSPATDASPRATTAGTDSVEAALPAGGPAPAALPAASAPAPIAPGREAPDPETPAGDDPSVAETAGRGIPDSPDVTDETTDASPRRPWWRRRIPVLWAGSVVVALLLGVGLTLGVQAAESGRIATLALDPEGEWPSDMFGSEPPDRMVFEEFHGLRVMAFSQAFGMGDVQTCMYIMSADQMGIGASGCGPDAFPATASLQVLAGGPRELLDAFETGTSLQFVLDGDRVHVYARAPLIVRPTP